jgi:hypothetical protein
MVYESGGKVTNRLGLKQSPAAMKVLVGKELKKAVHEGCTAG